MVLCSKNWLKRGSSRLVVILCLPCSAFFVTLPYNLEELMESLCLFRQCQHTLSLPLSLSLFLSHEVNIFCRKADGELVLTTSRSASQSLQSSRQPHCVCRWPLCMCVCATVHACLCVLQQCGISMADLYFTVHLQ